MKLNSKINQCDRLSSEQFKAILFGKGWSMTALAKRWGITRAWLSNLAKNPDRPAHYDDAVMALPTIKNVVRHMKRRQVIANAYKGLSGLKIRRSAGNRYHGHIVVGSILAVLEYLGTTAEIGMRGYVFAVRKTGSGEEYGVIFQNGNHDWFPPSYIDNHLVDTGLFDTNAYTYKSDETLAQHFNENCFGFYPENSNT